ncbi:MAG: hypothetical protein EZS28_040047 [Streblomastix strix]|uniref:Uncharacterized protein n=1 Tax=Streblomastix strix TaxID=222440 RepID=A0A5J4U1I9_9EUKA|nr:MAG: hypothetical protein EZS28_040047 [Streblomastix strix]
MNILEVLEKILLAAERIPKSTKLRNVLEKLKKEGETNAIKQKSRMLVSGFDDQIEERLNIVEQQKQEADKQQEEVQKPIQTQPQKQESGIKEEQKEQQTTNQENKKKKNKKNKQKNTEQDAPDKVDPPPSNKEMPVSITNAGSLFAGINIFGNKAVEQPIIPIQPKNEKSDEDKRVGRLKDKKQQVAYWQQEGESKFKEQIKQYQQQQNVEPDDEGDEEGHENQEQDTNPAFVWKLNRSNTSPSQSSASSTSIPALQQGNYPPKPTNVFPIPKQEQSAPYRTQDQTYNSAPLYPSKKGDSITAQLRQQPPQGPQGQHQVQPQGQQQGGSAFQYVPGKPSSGQIQNAGGNQPKITQNQFIDRNNYNRK